MGYGDKIKRPCIERLPSGRGCPEYAVPGGARCRTHGGAASPSGRVTQTWRWKQFRRQLIASSPRPWRCGICGDVIADERQIEVDHRVPVSAGGDPFKRSNCRLTHKRCNRRKSAKVPGEPRRSPASARLATQRGTLELRGS